MQYRAFHITFAFCCMCLLFYSCSEDVERQKIDYYHWKTDFSIGENQNAILKKSNSERLYVRFFDLVYDTNKKEVLPVATIQMKDEKWDAGIKIVPVVYITNEVFKKTKDSTSIIELAKNVAWKITRLRDAHFPHGYSFDEVQIDCDWTLSTKVGYFEFLKELKKTKWFKNMGKTTTKELPKLSVTLRLHQVKFMERTGIPPVDSATLMAYNVGDLGDSNETNSIINNEITKKYIARLSEYPLKFNLALPIYSWAVLYRDEAIVCILSSLTKEQLEVNFELIENSNKFVAKADIYLDRTFIYKGDVLRVEKVTNKELEVLCKMIESAAGKKLDILLYHINSPDLNTETLDEIKIAL